jgi:hypothetical protein
MRIWRLVVIGAIPLVVLGFGCGRREMITHSEKPENGLQQDQSSTVGLEKGSKGVGS